MDMQIVYKYSHIKLDQFATFEATIAQRPLLFQSSGEVKTGCNYEARTVLVSVLANVKVEDQLVLTIQTSSLFELSNETWDGLKQDGFVVVPKEFLYHLGGLAFSTTRGILFAKTEGTDLSTFVLPIVQMDQVIHEDLKILIPE